MPHRAAQRRSGSSPERRPGRFLHWASERGPTKRLRRSTTLVPSTGSKMSTGLNEIPPAEHGEPLVATNGQGSPQEAATAARNGRAAPRSRLRLLFRPLTRRMRSAEPCSVPLTRDEATAWSSWKDLRRELDRSRRYGRSFAIARLVCPRPAATAAGRLGRGSRAGLEDERVHVLSSLLRGVDRVWAHGENLYVLLPECDRERAEAMLTRIREPLAKLLHGEAVAVACFPKDGVASRALLEGLFALPIRAQPPVLQTGELRGSNLRRKSPAFGPLPMHEPPPRLLGGHQREQPPGRGVPSSTGPAHRTGL
jgi:hypothetical protein